jgi:hypothetical protein
VEILSTHDGLELNMNWSRLAAATAVAVLLMLTSLAGAQTVVVYDGPPIQPDASVTTPPGETGLTVVNPNPPAAAQPMTDEVSRGQVITREPSVSLQPLTVTTAEVPLDGPFGLSIEAQADTTRPFAASNYTANGSFTMRITDPATCAGTYTVQASPVAGSGPGGSTPPNTTVVAYIGFGQGTFFFNNAGVGDYRVTATETGACPGDEQQMLTVTISEGPLDAAFGLSIAAQVDTTRPFAAPNYQPNGSFTMGVVNPATCAGTYTVQASPVAGSGPGGSTPPNTAVVAYIGFGQGNFLFANAGVGDYRVTATQTGSQCVHAPGDEQRVLTVTINEGPFDTPYSVSVASQVNTSLTFNSPSYTADGAFTINVANGSCAGTYTIQASPVAGSGPGGSTPPNTVVVAYIGFGQGNFLFANAGIGDYLVTVTETGVCTFEPGNDPTTLTVSIVGNEPLASLDVTALDLGPIGIGDSAVGVVTVTSTGNVDLVISGITAPGAPFSINGGTCVPAPTVLPSGESCTIEVRFQPGENGTFSSSFDVVSNAASSPDTVDLRGVAAPVTPIPTLSTLGLIVMALLLLLFAGVSLRRRAD